MSSDWQSVVLRSPATLVLTAVLISLLVFATTLSGVFALWLVGRAIGAQSDVWAMAEGIAAVAMLAITLGGGVVVLYQVSEAGHVRNLAEFSDAFEILMNDEQIEARRWIYSLPDDSHEAMKVIKASTHGRSHVKRVLNAFDYLGFLVEQNWMAADEVIGWVSPIVVKTWLKIGGCVETEAERRGEEDFYLAARSLAKRCHQWRDDRIGETDVRWVEDAL